MTMNGTDPALELAREALRIAKNADDSVLNLHESFGGVTRELAGVRIEVGGMRGAMADLGKQVERVARRLSGRASQHDLEEVRDELEDTKVRNLRAELKKAQGQGRYIRWVSGGVLVGGTVEAIRLLLEHFTH
jgi:hypothetical protein